MHTGNSGFDSPHLNSRIDYVFLAFFFILVSHGTGPIPNPETRPRLAYFVPSAFFAILSVGSFTTCDLFASALRVRDCVANHVLGVG
jgi:hypothetical protein